MLDSSARLLRLLSLLQSRREWAGAELADRLGITVRTVRRDVERLRALGYSVHATPGAAGGYRFGAGASLPPLLLDDDEAVAVDASTLAVIAAACRDAERLRFGYQDRDSVVSSRDVEPHRLVHTGRHWYLVARDVQREAWRSFRVDRMTEPAPTGRRFTPQDPPDAAAYVSEAVSTAPYRHRARVRLHAPAEVVAQRVPPTVGQITALDAGSCLLTTGSDSLDAIAAHLAWLGIAFDVLEPAELVDRVRALADLLGRSAVAP